MDISLLPCEGLEGAGVGDFTSPKLGSGKIVFLEAGLFRRTESSGCISEWYLSPSPGGSKKRFLCSFQGEPQESGGTSPN